MCRNGSILLRKKSSVIPTACCYINIPPNFAEFTYENTYFGLKTLSRKEKFALYSRFAFRLRQAISCQFSFTMNTIYNCARNFFIWIFPDVYDLSSPYNKSCLNYRPSGFFIVYDEDTTAAPICPLFSPCMHGSTTGLGFCLTDGFSSGLWLTCDCQNLSISLPCCCTTLRKGSRHQQPWWC